MNSDVSIEAQAKAVAIAATNAEADAREDECFAAHAAALTAALATLRKVQACRWLAEERIIEGVVVAADIEGLIP